MPRAVATCRPFAVPRLREPGEVRCRRVVGRDDAWSRGVDGQFSGEDFGATAEQSELIC